MIYTYIYEKLTKQPSVTHPSYYSALYTYSIYVHVYINIYIHIFCLKNFDTFTRTLVRVSKMNAVARAQSTFQMWT